ncbi:MAG: hypothetical protein M3381_13530 [Actinomycetota bacterium]|nr:hypothetical protein [Actinomycetota bacterium]
MDVDYVRQAFREDAELAGPPPTDAYERVLARRQKSDRRRLATLAAGLAAVLVAVAVPLGLSLVVAQDDRAAGPPSIPVADIFGVPTRGSLAADVDFVEAVRQLSWAVPGVRTVPPTPDAPVESRRVVFAGDVAAGRWALVVGANTAVPTGADADPDRQTDMGALSDIAGVWFVGPPGAGPEQMQAVTYPRGIAADLPASLYDGASGALVVVAAPGDVIEISERPDVAADATVTRDYTDTGASDGTAVLTVSPNPFEPSGLPAAQYRVTRGGMVIVDQAPDGYGSVQEPTVPELGLEYLRPAAEAIPGAPDGKEQTMAEQILSEYGLSPDELQLRVHYVGPLPGSGEAPAGLTVLTATFPSGAVLTRADYLQQIGSPQPPYSGAYFGGGTCLDELSPAGLPAAERTLALRCDVLSGEQDPDTESTLVVLAPVGVSGAYAVADGDAGTTQFDLDAGVGMVAFPPGAESVVVHAADGTVLDEVPIGTA